MVEKDKRERYLKKGILKDSPISDASEDEFDRATSAEIIADTIKKSDEEFNFGISGSWGSGKTSILRLIKPHLEKAGFKVITFSPWKYVGDQLSLRRKFLLNMAEELGVEKPKNLYETIKVKGEKDFLGRVKVIGGLVFDFLLWFAVLSILFLILLGIANLIISINIISTYISVIFVPGVIALLPVFNEYLRRVTIEKTDPEVLYVEQFDSIFEDIHKEAGQDGKLPKLVFFIDDLDRCRGEEIIRVLSGLMTFFEKKKVHFVITADHTVIEKTLGKDIDIEDAREYLKKIFQINWIIPPILPNLVADYIKGNIPNHITNTKVPYVRDYLVELIQENFEANPRQITYFIRDLIFQIDVIESKIRQLEEKRNGDEELDNLKMVRKHPDLLAKILIIRNKEPDTYKTISENPQQIISIEEGKGETASELLGRQPYFSKREADPQYFVYLSGQTGFETRTIADPSKVLDYAKTGDIDNLKNVLEGSSDHKRSERLDAILDSIPEAEDVPKKATITKSFLSTINLLEETTPKIEKICRLLDLLEKIPDIFQNLESQNYAEIFKTLSSDNISIQYARKLFNENPYLQPAVRNNLWQGMVAVRTEAVPEILSRFSERLLANMSQSEDDQEFALDFVIMLEGELRKCENREEVIDKILEIFNKRELAKKHKPLDAMWKNPDCFNSSQKDDLSKTLKELISTQSLQEIIFVISNLNKIGSIIDTKKLVEKTMKIQYNRPMDERHQILDHLKPHHTLISDEEKKELLEHLLDILAKGSEPEKQMALTIVKTHPDFIPVKKINKRKILAKLLEIVKLRDPLSYPHIVEMFWNLKHLWEKDKDISSDYRQVLSDFSNDSDNSIAEPAKAILEKWS